MNRRDNSTHHQLLLDCVPAGEDGAFNEFTFTATNRLRRLDTIGSGGMGLVFKALHRSMDRIVALKVLPRFAVNSPEKVRRFQREIKATARLTHPNVVAAYDAHESNGTFFLVMEYVDGENLHEHVQRTGPLPVGDAVNIISQISSGLEQAHQSGIVHRDIKPTNIMLATDGTAKLLDLGLARTREIGRSLSVRNTGYSDPRSRRGYDEESVAFARCRM